MINVFFIPHKRLWAAIKKNYIIVALITEPYSSALARTLLMKVTQLEINGHEVQLKQKKAVWAFPWNRIIIHCCASGSNEENMPLSPKKWRWRYPQIRNKLSEIERKHAKSGFGWINPLNVLIPPHPTHTHTHSWNAWPDDCQRSTAGCQCVKKNNK